ncbi:hypothetical protein LCGC14_2881920, partial [marine sediment metagenome]
ATLHDALPATPTLESIRSKAPDRGLTRVGLILLAQDLARATTELRIALEIVGRTDPRGTGLRQVASAMIIVDLAQERLQAAHEAASSEAAS